ncbi:MAG: hypothetical protein AMXMBFR53_17530 [Gemmatimonadota bacterium]
MGRESRGGVGTGVRSAVLVAVVVGMGMALTAWKVGATREAEAAAAGQPEPMEAVTEAVAATREHVGTTTSIGTVLATRSVTLRNEVSGTVREVSLTPGRVVEAGALLVALDVSVEEAERAALQARADLAATTLARYERMAQRQAASAIELDNARAERRIALAEMARVEAVIERKTIRAPFRARVGIADVHPGQFLDAGTVLTTLQGVDEAVHVDFMVSQSAAAGLAAGTTVRVIPGQDESRAVKATVVAVDAKVDPSTRNAMVRARIDHAGTSLTPGASVQVEVPIGTPERVVVVPVSALRRGPAGDHVFVLETAEDGRIRARIRPVQAGPVLGDEVVVLQGVGEGERVAASGSFKLREGALVAVAGSAAAAQAAAGGEG